MHNNQFDIALDHIDQLAETTQRLSTAAYNYSLLEYSPGESFSRDKEMNDIEASAEINAILPFISRHWQDTQNAIFDLYRSQELIELSDIQENSSNEYHEILHRQKDIEQAYLEIDEELQEIDRALREMIEVSISEPHDRFRYTSHPNEIGYRIMAD